MIITQEIATAQTTVDNDAEHYLNTHALETIEGKNATAHAINIPATLQT